MAKLGTLSWIERTGGKLAWRDRIAMIVHGVRARAEVSKRTKSGFKVRNIEVDDILPPDSAISREATAICQDASAPYLFNHCLRAYFWARLLDEGRQAFDDEAVFTALMLHDLGLTDGLRLSGDREQCFTVVGARKAGELAAKHGWSDQRANITAQAITLHLNVIVDPCHGKEAQMVRAGAGGDVAGLDLDMLHADQIHAVVNRHPRLSMKREILERISTEADERPCCRLAFLMKRLSFADYIRHAPAFSE
jgi:hypothetical protein